MKCGLPIRKLLVLMPKLYLPNEAFIFYCSFPADATERHIYVSAFLFSVAYYIFELDREDYRSHFT